ncbi:unnamed protein product [Cylindrotheca closterium]|uniref:G-protein coupled receptors family 3 profile domain-containing protein n=1 Tax=Cylindrotheca closterium TaxID=2856 RepID=A0AAD2FJ50_9STRA|nr:unnamed protein product [Cylindrotheca closterium]
MPVEKLNRAFSHGIFFCLICLLLLVESFGQSLSRQFNKCDPNSNSCIQCWKADVIEGSAPKEASNMTEASCISPDMTFEISKGSTNKIYDWSGNPNGWLIHDRDEFKIMVKASVDWIDSSQFSRLAFEVQLCNIDNIMLCQPVLAPTTFFDEDITAIDEIQNLRTTQTPSVTRFVDLGSVASDTVEEELNFAEVTVPGTYRILTSLVLSNASSVSGVTMISNIKYLNVVHNDPMELSSESYTAIIVMSSVASTVILFLFFQTFAYRNAQVFELTQGKFIMAMQICALVATSSLIFFTPKDPFCQLSPLIYLSTHMVYAILLGRMWRIRAVISPLLLLTLERKDDFTTTIVDLISRLTACACWQGRQQKKIRMQITDYQLARVIMLLILPQLLVQLLILIVYYGNKSILLDVERDGLIDGVYICEYGAFYSTLHIIAVSLIGLEFFLLALLMWSSRELPSLFNETKKVWQILRATFIFVLCGTLLIAATIDHYNTAQVRVLVPAFVLGLNMCQTCWVITWSKLRVAWRGKKILVTKLIADHNFNRGKNEAMGMGSTKYFSHDANCGNKFSGYQTPAVKTDQTPAVKTETHEYYNTADVEQEPSIDIFKNDDQTENVASDDRSTDSSVFLAESQETLLDLEESEENENEGVAPGSSDASIPTGDAPSRAGTHRRKNHFSPLSSFTLFRRERRDKRGSNASRTNSVGPRGSIAIRGSTVSRGSMVVRRRLVGRGGLASSTIPAQADDGNKNRFSVFGNASMPAAVIVESIDTNPRLSQDKIRISEAEAPGRRLLLRMIDVQRMLANVNTSLLTGVSLGRDDWEELRVGCVTLGEVFENEVVFAWDDEDTGSVQTPQSLSQSHTSLPSRLQRHRPGNEPGKNRPLHSSMPPKSKVTSMTNAGPNRRSVAFKTTENIKNEEQDEFVESMLNKPLQTIMSIGSPIVQQKDETLAGGSESSTSDEIHELKDATANDTGLHGEQQQNPDGRNENLAKHRVRANHQNVSLPVELPIIEKLPVGVFGKGAILSRQVSGLSESSEQEKSDATSEGATDVATDQIPLGEFQ